MIHPNVQMARNNQDAMLQILQMLVADREVERAERQANLTTLQQIAQMANNNNHGPGNQEHHGNRLKNFQNTNPPMFTRSEEPLDADDWLQTIENNLEVAGVEENEKVLYATHYLSGDARAWWTSVCNMNGGQLMTWEEFKIKFSRTHVPQGLIKRMRDEFRELKQGTMTVVEYRDKFLSLARYAPDEIDTEAKKKERFLNGLHDEMQTVLVSIQFMDIEALVDAAIQMEGKINQAHENRKRRMMNQNGPNKVQKFCTSTHVQIYRPNPNGGYQKPGGNNNYASNNNNTSNFNHAPPKYKNVANSNNAPMTGNNALPVAAKDKSQITCFECGVKGHYSNECPNKLVKITPNTYAPAQQQRRVANGRNQNNRNSRFYHMTAAEAQEAPNARMGMPSC